MPTELVLTDARVVTAEDVVRGTVRVAADGRIAALDPGPTAAPGALDLEGDLLLPGLVDLHTDSLERHLQPRFGVVWDAVAAAVSHDVQIAGSGITTVFDSLTVGAAPGWDARDEHLAPMIDGLRTAALAGMLRAEHFLHLRCEITHPEIVALFESLADEPLVRMISLMDHAPGDRQSPDVGAYRRRYLKTFDGDEAAADRHIAALIEGSRTHGPHNRRGLAALARARRIPLASHDDAREAHIEEAAELGVRFTEFPTTVEAAEAARRHGLAVLMGAPNLIRGGSHSGNVAAGELAAAGLLDALASDYVPASLLQAAFRLAADPFGIPLPAAVAMVTRTPAALAGLDDRGEIAPGLRADLVRVRVMEGRPVARAVWRAGERVA
ncbi:MAG TPA: alpha-D-ribose 1-methylphosphonate 5-triphosphate diphosphatase [Geminicoccaceae bacterium]|nr:alpha-D-ribose 1-methylphosphonate 5-triphosphate diphosphatase [Geminicoccaceae bacterium]